MFITGNLANNFLWPISKYLSKHASSLYSFLTACQTASEPISPVQYKDKSSPGSSAGKESACNAEDPGEIPGSGSSPGEGLGCPLQYSWASWASLVAQMIRNLPAMKETWVPSLGWEAPLEEGMATHSSILVWRIPWTEEAGGLQSTGSQKAGHDWATKHGKTKSKPIT